MVAFWLDVSAPAVAVNAAERAPPATATEAGMVRAGLLLASVTAPPPAGAAWLRVTVQEVEAPAFKELGAQVSRVRPSSEEVVMEDPVAVIAMALPPVEAPRAPATPMVVAAVPGEIVNVTMAATPSGMVLAFKPASRQV